MNKGTADFKKKQDLIKFNINETEADITLVTEANHIIDDKSKRSSMAKTFKGFKIEESKQDNNDKSRCLMIIRNKIKYERLQIDESKNPTVAIKIKTKKNENTIIIGHY